MEKEINHPGMHFDEISLLPKSIVQVETAVPAFIGYTEKVFFNNKDLHLMNIIQPLEINSFNEYEAVFGGAPEPASIEIELDKNNSITAVKIQEFSYLYYSVRLFFDNGGTTCLIVSVGNYATAADNELKQQLLKGLACLEKTDAPTLLVMPDVVNLSYAEAGELNDAMLLQSGKLKNRFALLDLVNGNTEINSLEKPIDNFRHYLGRNYLSYGAAYYPWIVTTYSRNVRSNAVVSTKYIQNGEEVEDLCRLFNKNTTDALQIYNFLRQKEIRLKYPDACSLTKIEITAALTLELYNFLKEFFCLDFSKTGFSFKNPFWAIHQEYVAKGSAFHSLVKRLKRFSLRYNLPLKGSDFSADFKTLTFYSHPFFIRDRKKVNKHSPSETLKSLTAEAELLVSSFFAEVEKVQIRFMENLKQTDEMYNSVARAIEASKVIVPTAGAVAGTFSRVDRERGVWKAPANITMASVIAPSYELSQNDLGNLNSKPGAGKSVNSVCFNAGEGAFTREALTLAGDNYEWRYVNVRRFFIMVEQSVQEAIRPFAFEPNNDVTWFRVKTMVKNFLYVLWKSGALKGTKPEQAYFVKVGLGETMTASDIEKGLMVLITGMAVLKPAEFITMKNSYKIFTS